LAVGVKEDSFFQTAGFLFIVFLFFTESKYEPEIPKKDSRQEPEIPKK
jgi:hypothetical protein